MNPQTERTKLVEALGKRVIQAHRACGDYPETNAVVGEAALKFLSEHAQGLINDNGCTVVAHIPPREHELYPAGYWDVEVSRSDPDYREYRTPGIYINEPDEKTARPDTISLLGIPTNNMTVGMASELACVLLSVVHFANRKKAPVELP